MENKPKGLELMEHTGDKTQAHCIWWCLSQMKDAKSNKDVMSIMNVGTNHVEKRHDGLIQQAIPKELK